MDTIAIGNVKIKKAAALAPMASVADEVYRSLCKEYGACYVVSEMISTKGLCYGDRKTDLLCRITDMQRPMGLQLFGDDPEFMARAVTLLQKYSPDIIDINMGCPVPKVVSQGSGSALMKTPQLAYEIARAAVENASCPVTVKLRSGWDEDSINAAELAQGLEAAGVAAVAVHARTRKQFYSGCADWEIVHRVKQTVSIPVIGNGDVKTAQDCKRMYEQTGCDLVMIGRASYGRPWVFRQVNRYLETGELLPEPPLDERMEVMLRHAKMLCDSLGEERGMREARKHVIWYVKGLPGSASIRNSCSTLTEYSQLVAIAEQCVMNNPDLC